MTPVPQIIRAIIFDYDDTLVLSFQNYVERDLETCRKLGIQEQPRSAYEEAWGFPWWQMISQLHPGINPEMFMQEYSNMHSSKTTHAVKGMQDVLWQLRRQHYLLGIVSSKPSSSLRQRIIFFGIDKFIIFAHGSEDTQHHKPDPRAFKEALSILSPSCHSTKEILYVGDLVIDAVAAKGAGLSFVAVLTGPTTKKEFMDAGVPAKNILKSINDLPAWLEKQKE